MRILIAAIAFFLTMTATLLAGEAEGKIQSIDKDALAITLDDGNTYKLPGEFDVEALQEGMEILLAYDVVDGQNLITDMEISE